LITVRAGRYRFLEKLIWIAGKITKKEGGGAITENGGRCRRGANLVTHSLKFAPLGGGRAGTVGGPIGRITKSKSFVSLCHEDRLLEEKLAPVACHGRRRF